jgi:type I restriction enzyme R subunit
MNTANDIKRKNVFPLQLNDREALTNLIQLVRFAFRLIPELRSLSSMAASRFELWCGQIQRPLTESQHSLMKEIVNYIVTNGAYSNEELRDENITLFAQLTRSFGTPDVVNEMLGSLSGWMLKAG